MYESIRGTLKEKTINQAIVECENLAYRLTIPLSTYMRLPALESEVKLFLSLIVREDAHTLFAFLHKEERNLFELLLSISGVGPKIAATIIGHMEVSQFQQAINTADTRVLSKMPGIGKKTAERLIIEMRDKFKSKSKTASSLLLPVNAPSHVYDAIQALIHLGYPPLEATQAAESAALKHPETTDLGQLITLSLRHFS